MHYLETIKNSFLLLPVLLSEAFNFFSLNKARSAAIPAVRLQLKPARIAFNLYLEIGAYSDWRSGTVAGSDESGSSD